MVVWTLLVHDEITIKYDGKVILGPHCLATLYNNPPSGMTCKNGYCFKTIEYAGNDTKMTVEVNPDCVGGGNDTLWEFYLSCPR